MFIPTRKFFKPFNAALAALLLACAAPAWAEDIEAQFRQANAAYQAGNYQQAFHLMQPLAQQGIIVSAQHNLGLLYFHGRGVAQNYQQAAAWFQKAANQGHADAQLFLASMYAEGIGVAQDRQQAAAWFQKAAEQGHAKAQVYLGSMYRTGDGVKRNYQQALAWYRKAANQGDADAQFYLGLMYRTGEGVKRNYQQALAWYRKAADQGQADAQNELGIMYAAGEGVAKNDQQAIEWFNKVLAQPDTPQNVQAKDSATAQMAFAVLRKPLILQKRLNSKNVPR